MKLFISADIEGCAGVALTDETHKKESVYQRFAEEMTEEVVAACEAAHEAGADEIVVKDGHGDASNIDPLKMPEYVTLIRGKSGHPYNMMYATFVAAFPSIPTPWPIKIWSTILYIALTSILMIAGIANFAIRPPTGAIPSGFCTCEFISCVLWLFFPK